MTHDMQTQNTHQTDAIRNAWDAIAPGYDEYVTPTHTRLANAALDHLDIGPSTRFLDVAAGSGALGFAAAQRGAQVLATDLSPGMIERLHDNAQKRGLTNLTGQVMDGHDLDLSDGSVDASGSMFGVMLFPDLPRGLREMARVTRPGGQVLMVTFGPPSGIEFLGFFMAAARRVNPNFAGLPMDPPPLPFQVSDPAKLERAMVDAGLSSVRMDTAIETQEYESAAQLWSWLASSNPIGAKLTGSMPPDRADSVRGVLDEMLHERSGGSGAAHLTFPINIAVATA